MAAFADDILFAFWFFLPAGIANVAPFVAAKIPGLKHLNAPMDFGQSFKGIRILGPHKTWRGFVAGATTGAVTFWLQSLLFGHYTFLGLFTIPAGSQTLLPVWSLGILLGCGAVGGDAVKSFFKRRVGVAPGRGWVLFDQIDAILGAEVASLLVIRLPWLVYAIALPLWTLIHLCVQTVGFWLGIKERPL